MRKQLSLGMSLCSMLAASSLSGKAWKSGEILSYDTYRFGAFEARIKASKGSGAISSFYLLNDNSWEPGREWQEIDFELFGKTSADTFQTQIMTPGDPRTQNNILHGGTSHLSEAFHNYKMEWTPDSISFYLDGRLLRRETDRATYAKFFAPGRVEDMRLRISLWAGFSEWSGQIDKNAPPSPLFVDWIKYFSYDTSTQKFALSWQDDFNSFDASRWYRADWTFEYAVNDFVPQQIRIQDGQLRIDFDPE